MAVSPPAKNTPFDFVFTGTKIELTSLIDNWTEVANAGLLLREVNEGSLTGMLNRIRFQSSEDAANVHPMLIVEFQPLPAPEPSTLILGVLGIAGLMQVRRRQMARN